MLLRFKDAYGHLGRITDEFAVEYAGPVAIDEYVQTAATETASTEEVVEELIIGLVQDLDVEETQRAEPAGASPRPQARHR